MATWILKNGRKNAKVEDCHYYQSLTQEYKRGEIQRGKDETFLGREMEEGFFGTDGNTKPILAHARISNNQRTTSGDLISRF